MKFFKSLPIWAKVVIGALVSIPILLLGFFLALMTLIGPIGIERRVTSQNGYYEGQISVYNGGATTSYHTVIEVKPMSWFSSSCKAFTVKQTDPRMVDIRWETKTHLVVTVSEGAEIEKVNSCEGVTIEFERQGKPSESE